MQFQRCSNRLNYFFPKNSWALILPSSNESQIQSQLNSLRRTCIHWGSSLQFPLQLQAEAFADSHTSMEYWETKLPGLRLLHYRKQEILASQLLNGYHPQRAAKLFLRKLNLPIQNWGYLVIFGGLGDSYSITFETQPQIQELSAAVEQFYREFGHPGHANAHNHSIVDENSNSESDSHLDLSSAVSASQLQLLQQFEASNNLQPSTANILWLALTGDRNAAFSHINNLFNQEPDRIRLDFYRCEIQFENMNRIVKLPPLPFALYCLYLEIPEGFRNVDCENYRDRALYWYRRVNDTEDEKRCIKIINRCLNIREDKSFRDATSTMNRRIIHVLGDKNLAKPYILNGRPGEARYIPIDRLLVYGLEN